MCTVEQDIEKEPPWNKELSVEPALSHLTLRLRELRVADSVCRRERLKRGKGAVRIRPDEGRISWSMKESSEQN